MLIFPTKDPSEVLTYTFDWSARLAGDTITGTPTVTVTGAVKDSQSNSTSSVTVKISGGTAGAVAKVEATGVTAAGLTIKDVAVLMIGFDAVSVAEAKAWLRVETTDEDGLIRALLRAAIGHVETATGKLFSPRIVEQAVNGFGPFGGDHPYHPTAQGIRLWKGPASEVLAIAYDDAEAVEQALTSFRLVEGVSATLLPPFGETWPATMPGPGTVRITYVAGYDVGALPSELGQAALMLLAHWYQNREAVNVGNITTELPLGVQALIGPYRVPGLA